MIARWHYWLLTHPRIGRPATVLAELWSLSAVAVCAAPQAAAATNSMVLGWTGMHDTYGVSPGDYTFAVASIRDQIAQTTPELGLDPGSWMQWMGHTLALMLANVTAANLLTAEAGLFIGIVTLSLWLFRMTVSTYWLTVVGELARAITDGIITVTTRLGLLLVAVPIGVFAGVFTIRRGEVGRGWTMILTALTLPALSIAVFSDPASQMYGPDGVLAFGRRVGFSVAEAATRNGSVSGGGFDGQVDTLTASILTHTVREPLQLWNFGHVVDRVGACSTAWTMAVRQGAPDGPIRAMTQCGDRTAVSYAEHLDGANVWIGLVLVGCSLLLGIFMVASGWAVLKVSVKAMWTTAKLLPSLWLGGIPGSAQRHAIDTAWQFFRHGIEVLVYIVFVSVIGLAIERLVALPLPGQLGGTNPFAHVLMMGLVCIAACALLRHIHHDVAGHPHRRAMMGRATDVAVGMGMHAALGKGGSAALSGLRGLRSGSKAAQNPTPWEHIDQAAAAAGGEMLGQPRPGFAPVPAAGETPAADIEGRSAGLSPAAPRTTAAPPTPDGGGGGGSPGGVVTAGAAAMAPTLTGGADRIPAASNPQRGGRRRTAPTADGVDPAAAVERRTAGAGLAATGQSPQALAPITDTATTGYDEEIPPPPEPPHDEAAPPPPDDEGPTAATVDPINP